MGFREISIEELQENFAWDFSSIYSLISASAHGKTNMLTAAWAQVGFYWQRPVASVLIRPTRYTKELIDESGRFTVCLVEGHADDLMYLGTHSGRDEDKLAKTSLHLIDYEGDPIYEEAKLALVCKVVYTQQLDLSLFKDPSIVDAHYANRNVSIQYIGEIEKALVS